MHVADLWRFITVTTVVFLAGVVLLPQDVSAWQTSSRRVKTTNTEEDNSEIVSSEVDDSKTGKGVKLKPVSPSKETSVVDLANPLVGGNSQEIKKQETERNEKVTLTSKPSPVKKIEIDVKPVSFQEVEPGMTALDELKKAWGEPESVDEEQEPKLLSYLIEPFQQVDVTVEDQTVTSIIIHLDELLTPDKAAKELDLADIRPVEIADQFGKVMGRAYPERGVMFGFSEEDGATHVAQILLEPITAEPFVLRAQNDQLKQYENNLSDLNYAISLDPKDDRAHWLKAEVLGAAGRYDEALVSIEQAISLQSGILQYRLTRARLLNETGNYDEAVLLTKAVLADSKILPETQAKAEKQLGDLLAFGSQQDYKTAINHHLKAIEAAAALVGDKRPKVRRAAKRVLIDAHLAVARDVGHGNWLKKEEVVPKWLSRAGALVEDFIEKEEGHEDLRFSEYANQLHAYAGLEGKIDPTATVDLVITEGRRLITQYNDEMYQRQIQWELGSALVVAMKLERVRGKNNQALRYAESAISLLEASSQHRQATPRQNLLQGQLYFLIGSIIAVQRKDHQEALQWYDKSVPLLSQITPEAKVAELGELGEWMVSMGVSYWETGSKNQGMKLTNHGASLIQKAVRQGTVDKKALAIPFSNLASMYRHLGNSEKAKTFTQLASQASERRPVTRKR